ncbi:trans-sialidase, putative [Trypanosoma brucei brucei TREU927]|uniref:Trans-sialidase, putative n=1 Tax=Trypanosoma brucei brucei (strain 927/4 GUTat10.1) TaxID=185431 RepID=Q57VF2_TRYB2|nr:trans-sialidase, putative [Trypanosoma brucei brucei TREU927]AAX70417.1 trans-sialidase, putative [Trypanosoma brucei]AAZ11179.1 trans-sialidase, putative [Trypanosoma brucei brucei TREU927]
MKRLPVRPCCVTGEGSFSALTFSFSLYALLVLFALLYCCDLVSSKIYERTTREVFLEGGRWVRKSEWEKGSWKTSPEWNAGYEWWAWCMDSVAKEAKGEVCRKEWLSQRKKGYTLVPRTKVPFREKNGTQWMRNVHSFRVPSFVEISGVLVGIADVRYISSADFTFTETVAKYSADGGDTWKTKVIIENSRVNTNFSRVVDPTVAVKGNNIFVLVGRYNTSSKYWTWQHYGEDWDILMYKGTVIKEEKDGNVTASITFEAPQNLKFLLATVPSPGGHPPSQFLGGVGNTAVTPDGAIVFSVQVKNTWNQVVGKLLYSTDDGKTWHFSAGETPVGSTESSAVWWKDKLLVNARTDEHIGCRRVFETSDLGNTLKESIRTLSRVIGNSPLRNQPGSSGSAISITVEGMDVMLISQPKNTKGRFSRDRLQLWLTDGTRVFMIGQISQGDDNSPYSSLLYTSDGKLYCLYEQNIEEVFTIYLARLVDEMKMIKWVVLLWKAQDTLLVGDCLSSAGGTGPCRGIPVGGLAGLLSGPAVGHVWPDVYKCVYASVSGAVANKDGVVLGGTGKDRVVWPVGEQGQDQRYYFANTHFTIVATVQFGVVPQRDTPLIGFVNGEKNANKTLMLSIKNKKWFLTYGRIRSEGSPVPSNLEGSHQIALTLQDGLVTAYVDGKLAVAAINVRKFGRVGFLNIRRFFVGTPVSIRTSSHTTVTVHNALLYNRRLSEGELQLVFTNREVIRAANPTTPPPTPFESSAGGDEQSHDRAGSTFGVPFLSGGSMYCEGDALERVYILFIITLCALALFMLVLVFQKQWDGDSTII